MTTIRIDDDVHRELKKIKGSIQAKSGEDVSFDEVIRELISDYKKRHK